MDRIKTAIERRLRNEQAGFRKERSCTDQIATLRIIVEQCIEWRSPLYMCFIDFEKAFDSVDRSTMWNILSNYDLPRKFISIIKALYDGFTCQVIHAGTLTEPLDVRTGVRQGCLLSPILFLMVLDWTTRHAYGGRRRGIQWGLHQRLEDLEFADDIVLLSHRHSDMRDKLLALEQCAKKVGLVINIEKTKVMRIHHQSNDPISLDSRQVDEVGEFTYLGSIIDKEGGAHADICARIKKAQQAYAILNPVWRSTAISTNTKLRIFNSNVKAVLLYGAETWRTQKTDIHRLQVFINRCLRRLLKIRWQEKISNSQLWERAKEQPVGLQIKRRKWGWIGHTLRKEDSIAKEALDWNPQGKRGRGRPRNTWRRTTMSELQKHGVSWPEAKRMAGERGRWRTFLKDLCSIRSEED